MLITFIVLVNYANYFPFKFIRCPTKMKILKDTCPFKAEKLLPALIFTFTLYGKPVNRLLTRTKNFCKRREPTSVKLRNSQSKVIGVKWGNL